MYTILLLTVVTLLVLVATYYALALLVRELAVQNIFFTIVKEGTAAVVVKNGVFHRCLMSFKGHEFQGTNSAPVESEEDSDNQVVKPETKESEPHPADQWNIVLSENGSSGHFSLPLLRGIYWMGIYPFAERYHYHFTWTVYRITENKQGEFERVLLTRDDENISWILLSEVIYILPVRGAECGDNIPVDLEFAVRGHITNPYKALFMVQKWLEHTLDIIAARTRDFAANATYQELLRLTEKSTPTNTSVSEENIKNRSLDTYLSEDIKNIEEAWGFKVIYVGLSSVNPSGKLADDFVRATTVVYVANQKALADKAEGGGKRDLYQQQYTALAEIPGGREMYIAERMASMAHGNVTTLVLGGGVTPSVPLIEQPPPRNEK